MFCVIYNGWGDGQVGIFPGTANKFVRVCQLVNAHTHGRNKLNTFADLILALIAVASFWLAQTSKHQSWFHGCSLSYKSKVVFQVKGAWRLDNVTWLDTLAEMNGLTRPRAFRRKSNYQFYSFNLQHSPLCWKYIYNINYLMSLRCDGAAPVFIESYHLYIINHKIL